LGKLWAGIFITRQHNFELWNFIKAEFLKVNPVRKPSTFERGGSHGALNPVLALKGIISSSPLQTPIEAELRTGQAAGLSNGVNIIEDNGFLTGKLDKQDFFLNS
jgi:hypothetical protein